MTKEEIAQFDELYQYVKKEIMLYNENQSLSNKMVLRLKGLSVGKLFENHKIRKTAEYNYKIILHTFKIYRVMILDTIHSKKFKDETQKFMYIAAIVESKLNDVYERFERAARERSKTEGIDVAPINHTGAAYTTKTKKEINNKLNNLW